MIVMEEAEMARERVVDNLNRALHNLFEADPAIYLIGEDLLDPYGGAFKAAKNLSTKYPERVISTPISEQAILGLCNGLALCGQKPIAEIMFGDFICLAFDQIVNVASKAPTMFGNQIDYKLLVRCPVGGNRGYGPTHSQTMQKHFIGVPNLELYELSPFHDNTEVLNRIFTAAKPTILFEDKVLYTRNFFSDTKVNTIFSHAFVDDLHNYTSVTVNYPNAVDALIICGGGMFHDTLSAANNLFIEHELECEIIVSSKLYPFEVQPIAEKIARAKRVFVVEESTAGGTWGVQVAEDIYKLLWERLKGRIVTIQSEDSIIPSSKHLENQVLVQTQDIYDCILQVMENA